MTVAHGPMATSHNRSIQGSFSAAVSLSVAVALIVAATLLPVMQDSDATTTGYTIRNHQQELADLNAQTYNIQAQIAQLGSMERIRLQAAQVGMVPAPRQTESVLINAAAPAGTLLPRRYLPQPPAVARAPQRGLLENFLHFLSLH
jgi:cell division protein FtsL